MTDTTAFTPVSFPMWAASSNFNTYLVVGFGHIREGNSDRIYAVLGYGHWAELVDIDTDKEGDGCEVFYDRESATRRAAEAKAEWQRRQAA